MKAVLGIFALFNCSRSQQNHDQQATNGKERNNPKVKHENHPPTLMSNKQ